MVRSMKTEKQANWAEAWRALALKADARALIVLVSLGGTLAWLLPWPALLLFLPPAAISAWAAYALLPNGRSAFKAYMVFVLFWALSYFLLQLWEHGSGASGQALWGALVFGARLFTILGLALLLPLCLSAVTVGRALTWYIQRVGLLFRGRMRKRVMLAAWQAGLGLAIMAAFMPRVFRAMGGLSQNLKVRAPHLPAHRRFWLLGLSALRLLGSQTWDMSVSIAARGLYRPEPWNWREPVFTKPHPS